MRLVHRLVIALSVAAVAAACGGKAGSGSPDASPPDATPPDAPRCPIARQLVYNGTSKPTYVPLTQGQILAIGSFTAGGPGDIYCSGTLIAPHWVLTANHCEVALTDTFCFGESSTTATCLPIKSVHSEPYAALHGNPALLDLTLVELVDDATAKIPGVEIIPLYAGDETGLVGQPVEAAGYGETQTKSYNIRYFVEEMIDAVGPADDGEQWLRIDAMGTRGPCSGDSGGPAMVLDDQCKVKIVGALTWGDNPYGSTFCPGQDRYTRTDLAMSWITSLVGSTDGTCGGLDAAGTCSGTTATYCEAGQLKRDDCSASKCGWNGTGYRCIAGADPCGGVTSTGTCAGTVAETCTGGTPASHDCKTDGKICVYDADVHATTCDADPCMGYTFDGTCMGAKLYYCDLGQLTIVDCAAHSPPQTCGPVSGGGNDCK